MSVLASPTFSALAARMRNVALPSFTSGEVYAGGRGGWAVAVPVTARASARLSRGRVRVMRGSSRQGKGDQRVIWQVGTGARNSFGGLDAGAAVTKHSSPTVVIAAASGRVMSVSLTGPGCGRL